MSFLGLNMTPLGGNSRAGQNAVKNAPMGWAYQSATDNLTTVLGTGYFDTFNKFLVAGQFIYASLTDGKFFVTVSTVDRDLKQVVMDSIAFAPGGINSSSENPIGNITGAPGDLYQRQDGANSSLYTNIGLALNDVDWASMRENSTLIWSAKNMSPSTTINFLLPGAQDIPATTALNDVKLTIPRGGILKNFFVRHNLPAGNGNDIIYTVMVNAVATSISSTIPSNLNGFGEQDIINTVSVGQGDEIAIRAGIAVDVSLSPAHIYATLGFL